MCIILVGTLMQKSPRFCCVNLGLYFFPLIFKNSLIPRSLFVLQVAQLLWGFQWTPLFTIISAFWLSEPSETPEFLLVLSLTAPAASKNFHSFLPCAFVIQKLVENKVFPYKYLGLLIHNSPWFRILFHQSQLLL